MYERERYCKFSRRKYVCPYSEEERTLEFCLVCKASRISSQLNLIIKQNNTIIDILDQIRKAEKRSY